MKMTRTLNDLKALFILAWWLTAVARFTSAQAASLPCTIPPGSISYRVQNTGNSFTPVSLLDCPGGYFLTNRTYEGWCAQYDTFIDIGPVYHAGFYDSYSPLPNHLQGIPWDKVNYILNHKRGSVWDIQYAIWYALGQAPNPPATTDQVELMRAVDQYGAGFVPTNGQVFGILVESREGVQRVVLEARWDDRCRDQVSPTCALTSPANGNIISDPQSIAIYASATDNLGVTLVEFYNGPTLVTALTSGPYVFNWNVTEANNGTHSWTVRAYDYAGNVATSAPRAISVAIDVVPPLVSISTPAADTTYSANAVVPVTAVASDNFGVARVEFYDRSVLRATVTSSPYVFQWTVNAAGNGTHNWTARAYDAAGNSSVSALVAVDVAIDEVAPVVFIAAPAAETTYALAQQVTIVANAADNFAVTRVDFFDGPALIATRNAAPFTYDWNVTAAQNGAHQWSVRAYDAAGHSTLSVPVRLHVAIDLELPVVGITSPADGASISNQLVSVTGTASDNYAVARVEFSVDDGPYQGANGTTSWSASLSVAPGLHVVRVKSIDTAGRESISVARNFRYFQTAPLQLHMAGHGRVVPNLNGMQLELNRSYTVTAVPDLGNAFSNWSGGMVASAPQITFVMHPNLVLQANFISDVFTPVKGSYNGLFYDTNGVLPHSSGYILLTTTSRGTFTGKLFLGGEQLSISGKFDAESKFTGVIQRPGRRPLTIHLHLYTLDGVDYVGGTVSDGTWTAILLGDRVNSGASTLAAGRYTVALPGDNHTTGDGYGTVQVNAKGRVNLKAVLGDGTKLRQRAFVSSSGQWPLYVSLYHGAGALLGWVNFENRTEEDLIGTLSWTRPSVAGPTTTEIVLVGSRYFRPTSAAAPVLNLNAAQLTLAGANLVGTITNGLQFSANNRVADLGNHQLTLRCAIKTGLFSGSLIDPGTGQKVSFKGSLLQKRNAGFGLFKGTNSVGSARLTAAP